MKVKALVALKTKFFRPCRKLFKTIKFKLRKPLFIRPTNKNFRNSHTKKKNCISTILSRFRKLKVSNRMDRLMELRSFSESGTERMLLQQQQQPLYLSPITQSYVKACGNEEVEDACRSFENYLVEMIVEEGKVGDLTDVEELLYCWKNLKCPVFVDLVCRFYGELCKDLFSLGEDDSSTMNTPK